MAGGWDKLTPEGRKFYAELANLKENEVFIGFQAGKTMHTDEDGKEVDMAQIAAFNELGTSNSPSRPFLRQTVDDNQDKIDQMCAQVADRIAKGGSAEQGLKQLGAFGVMLVQDKIRNGSYAPNAPSTVRRKGSDQPLIDTGQMRQSVHYIVRKKGDGE